MRGALLLIVVVAGCAGCAGMSRCKELWFTYRCAIPGDDLRCSISADPVVKERDPVLVRFTLTNTTRNKVFHVIATDTPLAEPGIGGDVFVVRRGNERLQYQGVFADWFPHRCERVPCDIGIDYKTLAPGQSISKAVDLRDEYSVTTSGRYHVSYRGRLTELIAGSKPPYYGPLRTRPPGPFRRGIIDCNPVTITVEPR